MTEQTLKPELQAQETAKKASYFEQEYNLLRMKYEAEQDKVFALKYALREALIVIRCYQYSSFCPETCPAYKKVKDGVKCTSDEGYVIKKAEELLK